MKPLPLLILWGLGFLLIAMLCIRFSSVSIENELIQKTHDALANKGFHSVIASANGQTITLQGSTTSDEHRQQAESITNAINGVNAVNNQLITTVVKQTHKTHHETQHVNDTSVIKTTNPTVSPAETKPTGVYPPSPLPIEKPFTPDQAKNENNNTLPNTRPSINNPPPQYQPSNGMMPMPFMGHNPIPPWGNNGNGFMPYPYPPVPYHNMPFGNGFGFPLMPQAPLPPIAPMPPMPPAMPFNTWMR